MKTVIKRGGSIEPFNLEKIQVVIHRACKDLDVNPLELEATVNTTVKDGTSTETIQQSLIEKAKSLISLEESDWTYVAGRLAMQQYRKNCIRNRKIDYGPRSFVTYVKSQIGVNRYDSQLLNYSEEQLEQIANFLAVERDDNNNIGSVDTITKKYLLPNELIQEAYLVIAMMLHLDTLSVEAVKTTYDYISNKKISLATPVFLNLRKPDSSLSSCFIIDLDDDLEEILRNHANTARISKNSGGVGTLYSRVRAAGSYFQGEINKSGGTIPFIKITNDYAVAVNQGGKRAGAVTPGLDIWHADVPDFIEMRRETGSDIRQKCLDVFPQLIIPDLFMKYLKHNMTLDQQKQTEEQWVDYKYWYLVCPYEIKKVFGVDLVSLWGDAFEQFYEGTLIPHIESDTVPEKDKLKIVKKVKPIDIIREVINSYLETGLPYLVFKDTINKYNVNKHDGFIGMVNLCVAPETKILTDKGQLEIGSLKDQEVNVWNGQEWSPVTIIQTGTNQKMLTVTLSNGVTVDCTEYHGFYVVSDNKKEPQKIQAKDLKPGMKLIKYKLPVISNEDDTELDYAYTQGFFCGDGSVDNNGKPEIDLYSEKKQLVGALSIRNKSRGGPTWKKELDEIAIYEDKKNDRLVCKLPLDMKSKFFVPLNGYSIQSRLDWFAGLCDADAVVVKSVNSDNLQLCSNKLEFLREVRLMLQTLGVDSKIIPLYSEGFRLMPDGKGGKKNYFCKATYRLLVTTTGLLQLSELGFKTNRLKWKANFSIGKSKFIRVKSVEDKDRYSDTYCFTEHKRGMGMFNGVLLSNCVESFSNFKNGVYAHCCNLLHINLANIDSWEELEEVTKWIIKLLDRMIDLTNAPIPEANAHNRHYRTIGQCSIGLADWLAKNNKNYHTGREWIRETYERMALAGIEASVELAKEKGAYEAFEGSEWANGNLISKPIEWYQQNAQFPERWEQLRTEVMKHGIRNSELTAVAPNTTSSLAQGCTASFLPPYSRFFVDSSSKGAIPQIPQYIKDKFMFYTENLYFPQEKLIEIVGQDIQPYITAGISMELSFPIVDEEGNKLKKSKLRDCIIKAWEEECKAIYYIRTRRNENDLDSCSMCAG